MKYILASILIFIIPLSVSAQTAPDTIALTQMLREFLDGASRNDPAAHDKFWAEDLIYTRSAGRRTDKAELMRGLRSAPPPQPDDPKTYYYAEDIRIQQYGDTAILAFRLVSKIDRGGHLDVSTNLNTGTFLKRNGKWQVVAWQSTRVPRTEEESKAQALVAEAAFHSAMLTGDVATVESLTDANFVWTHRTGEQWTRRQLIDELKSGALKFVKLSNRDMTAATYGETVVVRGSSIRQYASKSKKAPPPQGMEYYTIVFVHRDGSWKAVALHTS